MFEYLGVYRAVIVTGPQRAGTRIAAKMIAHDTGFEYVDERDYHTDSLGHFVGFLNRARVAIQAPTMCRYAHYFGDIRNVAIVLMRRPLDEIVASQKRIKWGYERVELMRYERMNGNIAQVKYDYWDRFQKARIVNAFEVEYHDLEAHPLWLPPEERQEFGPFQTATRKAVAA